MLGTADLTNAGGLLDAGVCALAINTPCLLSEYFVNTPMFLPKANGLSKDLLAMSAGVTTGVCLTWQRAKLLDERARIKEGHCANFGTAGACTEMPGCSLCLCDQAQQR